MSAEGELLRRIQAALARVDVEADALVDDAWHAARAEVRTVLQRAFQQELLDRVAHVLEGGPPDDARVAVASDDPVADQVAAREGPSVPPAAGPAPAPHTAGDPRPVAPDPGPSSAPAAEDPAPGPAATYVFGITRASVTLDPGLPRVPGGGAPRSITQGEVCAVVCDVDTATLRSLESLGPDDLDQLAAVAHAHDEVLARIAAQAPVLPLRLATVVGDDEVVRDLLSANDAALRAELDRVEGHAEWAVVVRVTDRVLADDEVADDAGSGQAYLRRRQAALGARERRREARHQLATEVHQRLAGFAVAAEVVGERPLEQVPPALHGVYLLAWDRIGPFEDAVEEVRAAHPDAIIEATGPWPPYHFTNVDLTLDGGRTA